MVNLDTKERYLLEDAKTQEALCVAKYKEHSEKASCPELKHLDTINQILSGTVPNVEQNQSKQGQQTQQNTQSQFNLGNLQSQTPINMQANYNETDKLLCEDGLSMEKYVSATYNTSIFEFRDENIRKVLNHIQTEEQGHGKKIYDYMHQHGMYN